MAKDMVTAKASKGGGKHGTKKRHVSHMHIKPSKNGGAAIESHFHAPPRPAGGADDAAAPYAAAPEPEMHTFGSPEEAGAHVTSMLQNGYPVGGDQDEEQAAPPAE